MIDAAIRFGDGNHMAFVRDGVFGFYSNGSTIFAEPLETAASKVALLADMVELARGDLLPELPELEEREESWDWPE